MTMSQYVCSQLLFQFEQFASARYKVLSADTAGVVVVTRPPPRDGGMAEAPEARQLPRAWTRDRRETKSHQRVSGAKSLQLDSAE